jgi:hypothetical protein
MLALLITLTLFLIGWYLIKNKKKKTQPTNTPNKPVPTPHQPVLFICNGYSEKSFDHALMTIGGIESKLYIKKEIQNVAYMDGEFLEVARPGYYISLPDEEGLTKSYIEIGENGSVILITNR